MKNFSIMKMFLKESRVLYGIFKKLIFFKDKSNTKTMILMSLHES